MTGGTHDRNRNGQWTKTLAQAELDTRAVALRSTGLSYRAIGRLMDVSMSSAHRMVLRALAAVPVQAVGELRRIELERLDALTVCAFAEMDKVHPYVSNGRLIEGVEDSGPVLQAIGVLLRISESRRRLLGLDAPSRLHVLLSDEMTAEIEALAQELGVSDLGSTQE
jgi:hypothetical protein